MFESNTDEPIAVNISKERSRGNPQTGGPEANTDNLTIPERFAGAVRQLSDTGWRCPSPEAASLLGLGKSREIRQPHQCADTVEPGQR